MLFSGSPSTHTIATSGGGATLSGRSTGTSTGSAVSTVRCFATWRFPQLALASGGGLERGIEGKRRAQHFLYFYLFLLLCLGVKSQRSRSRHLSRTKEKRSARHGALRLELLGLLGLLAPARDGADVELRLAANEVLDVLDSARGAEGHEAPPDVRKANLDVVIEGGRP